MIDYSGAMGALLAAILIFFATQTAAVARSLQDKDGTWWTVIDPPARFLGKPNPAPEVFYLPREDAFLVCKMATGKAGMFGCAQNLLDGWDITIVDDLPKPLRDEVLIHEQAHCNGWPADHPLD